MKPDAMKENWRRLAAAGLVTGDAPADAVPPPWYVRAMLGFAGWIGALFLFGFLALFLYSAVDGPGEALFIGALLCGVAWFLLGSGYTNEFAIQFGLAVSMAGQGMMAFGVASGLDADETLALLGVAVVEAAVALLLPNVINRFIATLAATLCLGLTLASSGALGLAPTLATVGFAMLWLQEFRFARHGAVLRPVAYGLLVSAIAFDLDGLWSFWSHFGRGYHGAANEQLLSLLYRAGQFLQGATLPLVAWRLLAREGAGKAMLAATLSVTLLLAVLLSPAPGVITALVAMVLGFANGNRLLTGLGLFAAVGYLGSYYYQMNVSLLDKAGALCATGLVLLIARALFLRFRPGQCAPGDGHA